MSEVTAKGRYACPACGAEATWNPAKKALVCSFCGTTSPANEKLSTSGEVEIVEHDLMTALRSIPDEGRGWKADRTQVRCQSCQAISVFAAEKVGQRCDFCGSSALVPYQEQKEPFKPESLLEFKLSANDVRDRVKTWLGSRWFAPSALKGRALTDTVRGLYVPYWTFDAQVHADWTAMSGYHYYVSESFTDRDGKMRTRQVRKTRWVPSSGALDHFFDDTLVAASRGLDRDLLPGIEPFPTQHLKPYDPGYLAGWVVERYQIDLGAAAKAARDRMDSATERLCAARVPGDTHTNLQVQATYTQQTFKHILVPVWLLTYHYHGKPFQVMINGHSGTISGRYPKSVWKILGAILLFVVFIGLILAFAHGK